jgi:3-(3-hydroxy-phenyl)propionate hydroxylase
MTTKTYDADVAIVGYGPTGLIGALTLANKGVSVIALEREQDIYQRARAVTVNDGRCASSRTWELMSASRKS